MVKKSLLWMYRATMIALWLIIIVLASSVLLLRYAVLPNIHEYKDQIAAYASSAAGLSISIGDIRASWDGLNPHFDLAGVQLLDAKNRAALSFDQIEANVSWLSLPLFEPRLSAITIDRPALTIRREKDGVIYVAGIAMGREAKPEFANWLLRQAQIDVLNATITWQDDLRQAPPLTLTKLRLQIQNPAWESLIGHHRFALRALPSAGSSQPIDLRGNFYGRDVGRLHKWHGTLYGHVEGTDIAAWRNWLDYPIDLRSGFGAARFWLNFDNGHFARITSDVILHNVVTPIDNGQTAHLQSLSGRLHWQRFADGQQFSGERIKLITADGLAMQSSEASLRQRLVNGEKTQEGKLKLDAIDLSSLDTIGAYLPLAEATQQKLDAIAPQGRLRDFELSWNGKAGNPSQYSIRSRFSGLGMQAYADIPGFSNLSGYLQASESSGIVNLNAQQAMLDFKGIMRNPIPASKLSGQINWQQKAKGPEIALKNLVLSNPHLSSTINASYQHQRNNKGHLDLNAKISRADAKFAHYYYPALLGEKTLNWLDSAILAGRGEDVNIIVKGNLQDFPFADGKSGLFKVTARVSNGELAFAPDWPKLQGLGLNMLFQGNRMELNADRGSALGSKIIRSKVVIAAMDSPAPVLEVNGDAQGTLTEAIQYVNNSPLARLAGDFTRGVSTSGNGKLHLQLSIPLNNASAARVKGDYQIMNGSMASSGLPQLSLINGKLTFTENGLAAQNISTWVYGGPASLGISTDKDSRVRIVARGNATDAGLKQAFGPGPADFISGSAEWAATINIQQQLLNLSIRSSLAGMAISLPAPLNKAAATEMPLAIEKKQQNPEQDSLQISLGDVIDARLLRSRQKDSLSIERGEIGFNMPAAAPTLPGVGISGSLQQLDIDQWRNILDKADAAASWRRNLDLRRIRLKTDMLDAFDRRINDMHMTATTTDRGWQIKVDSREIGGDIEWLEQGNGKVRARLDKLIVPAAVPGTEILRTQGDFKQQAQKYPELDITAETFEFDKKQLGRLELNATEQDEDWSIDRLRISNPDSILSAEGEWHNWKRNPNTRMNLTWAISDIGKTLARYSHPGTIKGGKANLSGQLKWPGSPLEFDINGLSGNLQLVASNGQVLKIKPGVGRLFSVLTLQNLPRRLTFDFRDVFSSGFTFDKISTSVRINAGVMQSNDFRMEGPTALVEIKGQTDLSKETQHLHVKVTPYLSDSLSLAALAGGPVAGAAAYIAQKLLKDPINQFAAEHYEITGTWDNPIEVKGEQDDKPLGAPSALGN